MSDAPTTPAPASDAFASAPNMTPAPAAPATPSAPAEPNPFNDATMNPTEQGRLVRENPNLARDFIKAAGKEKIYGVTLEKIEADRATAITQSISTEAVTGEHDAVRLAKLNHKAESDYVKYSVDGSEAEHRELTEKVAKMAPQERMVDVETTFQMLTYGESEPYIRAMSTEQKASAHKIVSDFVKDIGSDAGQFQADVSRLPAAAIGAFMSELGSGKHTDERSLFVGVSKALSQGKNAARDKSAITAFASKWFSDALR
jgi:hypothetical protein